MAEKIRKLSSFLESKISIYVLKEQETNADAETSPELAEQAHLDSIMRSMQEYQLCTHAELHRRLRNLSKLSNEQLGHLPLEMMNKQFVQLLFAAKENQKFFDAVLALFCRTLPPCPTEIRSPGRQISKVRSTLHQAKRDWSSAGVKERSQSFGKLIEGLEEALPVTDANRNTLKVLCPGAGLGRLPFELATRGYCAQGNEFSYFMLLTGSLLMNACEKEQFAVYPWIHNPSNKISTQDVLEPIRVPDVSPSSLTEINPGASLSMVAGEFLEVYRDQPGEWDAICMCFFLDTAPNVLEYLELCYSLLKPGGFLLNLGPLQYHWQQLGPELQFCEQYGSLCDPRYSESVELSLEEVLHAVASYGFEIKSEKISPCDYTHMDKSLHNTSFEGAYWVAQKPFEAVEEVVGE